METRSRLERLLGVFSDVRSGEGLRAVGMLASLLLLMLAYYVLKTVREPLILATGGAEMKSYAAAIQAVILIAFVPAYSWFTRRVGRQGLILGLTGFFFVNLQLFWLGLHLGTRFLGIAFFVWVGIFSLSVVAQFWSLATDLYSQEQGQRLFPIIAFGATMGSPIGARVAKSLFERGFAPATLMQIAAGLLLLHGIITFVLARTRRGVTTALADRPITGGASGFSLVLKSPYLRLVAVLLVLLNVVNTIGEYVLSKNVVAAASAAVASGQAQSQGAFIGSFYGGFYFWVNVSAALLQALIVSRLVKRVGIAGVLLFLPLLALGVYGTMAAGAGFAVVRWLKTAENATDYSIMNTARAMLWLPTSRDEKYRAKQAIDTFFVRLGDVLATGVVAVATLLLHLGPSMLAAANGLLTLLWVVVAWRLAGRHRALSQAEVTAPAITVPATHRSPARPVAAQLRAMS